MSEMTCPTCNGRGELTPEERETADARVAKGCFLGFIVGLFIPAVIWAWNFHR